MGCNKEKKRLKRKYYKRMSALKNWSLAWGLLGMFAVWGGLFCHMTGKTLGYIKFQNNPEKYNIPRVISKNAGYFDQFHTWMPVMAAILITLMCMFALIVKRCLPKVKHPKFDAFAHLVAALILGSSVLLLSVYMANVYFAVCGENGYVTRKNNEIQAMNNNKTGNHEVKWSHFSCTWAILAMSTSIPTHINQDDAEQPDRVGFFSMPFLSALVAVLGQGVWCFRIFVLAINSRTVARAPPAKRKDNDDGLSKIFLI